MKKAYLILAGILVLFIFWFIGIYNGLVSLDVGIDESWAQVEVQYQRRFDLIPNLVETVKGVTDFEASTYQAVTEARSAWTQSLQTGTRGEQIAALGGVESALSRLLVTVENYPQLKAQENFLTLQAQLEGAENRVATARRDYNQSVRPYNARIRKFPAIFVARFFGFEKEDFFENEESADSAPKVNFGN